MKTSKQRREQRKRAKARMDKSEFNKMYDQLLGTSSSTPLPSWMVVQKIEVGRKEPTMYEYNETEQGKKALLTAVDNLFYNAERKLERKYGLVDDEPPQTAQQFVDAITNKQYVLPAKEFDNGWMGNWYGIKWRDPSKVVDRDGFNAAYTAMRNQGNELSLLIKVSPVADGYDAFKTFKANVEASYA